MEPLDLALGLRVPGGSVLLADAEQWEEVFEGVAAAAEAGGVDPRVVGQGAGRRAVIADNVQENSDDIVAGDRVVGGRAQQVAGVVIQPVENFCVGPVGQAPVGEVGLPHLVWLGGGKPHIGASEPFAWLGGDQALVLQDPADRRCRRLPQAFALQMPGDRHRAGV